MTPNDIRTSVAEKVAASLPGALLEAGISQHIAHGFKTGCGCEYCAKKRVVSHASGQSWRDAQFKRITRELLAEKVTP